MNNFREWLSDNLRYILLLIGILAVLLAMFFGVRTLTGGGGSRKEAAAEEVSVTEKAEIVEEEKTDTEEEKKEEAAPADHGSLTENADPEVSKLISDYYAALGARNVAAVRTMTDELPEEDAVAIEGSTTQYSDIHVYTKNGPAPGSLVVFASYDYQNENQPAALPGLAQMLAKKAADGSWKISYAEQDEATKAYMESVKNDDDVKALIEEVTAEYNEAVKAMEESASEDTAKDGESKETDASSEKKEGQEGEEAAVTEENSGEAEGSGEEAEKPEEEKSEESEEAPEEEAAEEGDGSTRGAEILSSCNVRSGPGYEYQILGEVRTGTSVTVIGDIEDGWWHIRTEDLEGYVGRKFIPEA